MIEVIWLADVKYVWPGPLMSPAHLWTHLALVFPDARLSPRMARVTRAGGGAEAVTREHLGPADGLRHQHRARARARGRGRGRGC